LSTDYDEESHVLRHQFTNPVREIPVFLVAEIIWCELNFYIQVSEPGKHLLYFTNRICLCAGAFVIMRQDIFQTMEGFEAQ